jgi:hypothetical protein
VRVEVVLHDVLRVGVDAAEDPREDRERHTLLEPEL